MAAKTLPTGFSKVGGTSNSLAFQNPANWSKAELTGRMIQGTYEGRLAKDVYGKENHQFTATTDGEMINSEGDVIPFVAGTTVILNDSGNLTRLLSKIEIGTEVIVDYEGKQKLKSGPFKGKSVNNYSVYSKA